MAFGATRKVAALLVAAAVEAVALAALLVDRRVRAPEAETGAAAGAKLAAVSGCFACHGPGGTGHLPNPGAAGGEVPGFVGGTPMMYADSDNEIAQYIKSGMPSRRRADAPYLAARQKEVLHMPAYEAQLSDLQIGQLVAWVKAVSGLAAPQTGTARQGFDLAASLGCFGCHGPMGSGGTGNPGSLKGYVPAWTGPDFAELARDDGEIKEWITTGTVARLEANPAARHFLATAAMHMPAFGPSLAPNRVDQLVGLIHFIRSDLR